MILPDSVLYRVVQYSLVVVSNADECLFSFSFSSRSSHTTFSQDALLFPILAVDSSMDSNQIAKPSLIANWTSPIPLPIKKELHEDPHVQHQCPQTPHDPTRVDRYVPPIPRSPLRGVRAPPTPKPGPISPTVAV